MPHWLIKSAAQRVISWLPNSQWWNEQFQRHVTRSLEHDVESFEMRVRLAERYVAAWSSANPGRSGPFTALELGTGWFPVVPICLWLCGVDKVWTYDIVPLTDRDRLAATFGRFVEWRDRNALSHLLPSAMTARVSQLAALSERAKSEDPVALLGSMGIHVRVQDARHTDLAPASVDVFTSSAVLEYIPRPAIAGLFAEFRRVARAGAVSSHYINLADQYHYFDRSISPLNFLRFSEGQWRIFNSPLTPLNRLRHSDYQALLRDGGWRIIADEPDRGTAADLDRVPLAEAFRRYEQQDLLVLTVFISAQLEPAENVASAPRG